MATRLFHGVTWTHSLCASKAIGRGHILVTGHTHQFTAYKHEAGVVINPGSATGAYISITHDVNPSFVLMEIDALLGLVYVYELIIDGEVKVDKIDFKKTTTQSVN